jgi:hypothetical protein
MSNAQTERRIPLSQALIRYTDDPLGRPLDEVVRNE